MKAMLAVTIAIVVAIVCLAVVANVWSASMRPGTEFRDCPDTCPEMVVMPTGDFTMGSPQIEPGHSDNERPEHRVTIAHAFAVGKFDITFAEWDACAAAGGCRSYRPDDRGWGRDNRPVIGVNWDDAQSYLAWLSRKTGKTYRLLSEAEWEYVARAGTTTAYYWGNGIGRGNANCDGCDTRWDNKQTSPVGSFQANAFGLFDMAGNVFQWTADCFNGSYDGAPSGGRPWVAGDCSLRVLRGGSWNFDPPRLRSAYRHGFGTEFRSVFVGFRVARTL